jgi:hypothetical protein
MTENATGMVRIEDPKDAPKVCVHAFNAVISTAWPTCSNLRQ